MAGQEAGNNISNSAEVIVVGDHASVHVTPSDSAGGNSPDPNLIQADEPMETSSEDEFRVAKKVSDFTREDYKRIYSKVNRNPLKPQQTFLTQVFVSPDLEHVDSSGVHDLPAQNGSDLMYNIFDKSTRVLFYGETFSGKSLLCQKYAYDWANHHLTSIHPFNQFELVILLKLCQVNGSLEEIFEREIFCGRLTEQEKTIFLNYMAKNPTKFLVILDGVDECTLEDLQEVQSFLLNKSFREVYLIATVCTELNDTLLEVSNSFHTRYFISRFSPANVNEYAKRYFCQSEEEYTALSDFLESNSDVMDLARLPLVTMVMCELWNELGDQLTLTKLLEFYENVVRKLYKKKSGEIECLVGAFEELAAQGVLQDTAQFKHDMLTDCKVDPKVGFLNAGLNDGSYKFVHEKLQQFLAARWMLQNRRLDGIESILITIESGVLIFIAGLLGEEKDDNRLLQFLEIFTKSVSTTFIEDSCYGEEMDVFLACVAEACNDENSQAILCFCKGFEPFKKLKCSCGYPPDMTGRAAHGLSFLIRNLGVEKLHLSGISILESEAKIIAFKCLEKNNMIKCVNLSHCCLSPKAVKVVCEAFKKMSRLENVDLSCCNLGEEGLKLLADLLQDGQSYIKSLQLGSQYERVTIKGEPTKRTLSKQLSWMKITNLTEFEEERNKFPPSEESIKALIAAVETCSELVEISLPSSCVGNLVNRWLEAFACNTDLERVKIHLKEISDVLENDLVELVKKMPQLNTMNVIVENEEYHRLHFTTHSTLEERSGGKIKLTIKDHTQSVKDLRKVLSP